MTPLGRVGLDVVAWAAIQAGCGYAVNQIPLRALCSERWLWRERPSEEGFYLRRLRIRRWKHLLPDAGLVFGGGFARRHLAAASPGYLGRFVAETRRAELNHWLALVPAPVFVAWNPPAAMPILLAYAAAANLPCIAVQRYNRLRLVRVLGRSARSNERSSRARLADWS